ncbi:5-bromo-4-chloroindolyl phosphate hydrolysis family protein [Parasulfitobacter algicola]|uniref:5-bromo-4-chloroindolyl phosphate hydrolysis family protein n=1 Tax=Parasulfitobacter algicola TaxID=2614809 RepID=A0ABX2IW08_9RHOB|nr:5-bromo-4-chloroindolyl phosphate hydrolysis family protein [Sulfitobacter algicola]NSX54486.1 5-bromo-4-chloroindolyl phosphate hydrolysis family protein [Sulfitobacter algicola]
MAQRFGGKFSPDGKSETPADVPNAYTGKKRTRVGGRVNLLFFAPFPLAIRAFWSEPVGLALNLTAFGLLILAAWLTREGMLAHEAYDARRVAKRPAIPRKIFASILTGWGLGLAGFSGLDTLLTPIIFATVGTALHMFAFGIDPLTNKGMEDVDTFQQDRVARAVGDAEKHVVAMNDAIKRLGDRALERRVDRFSETARKMFRTIEDDPRDLTAARKYLSVYLKGARDATIKFSDLYPRKRDGEIRTEYETLLTDLEDNFAAKTEKMLLDDRSDMDIEIKVLRDRLQREGLKTD